MIISLPPHSPTQQKKGGPPQTSCLFFNLYIERTCVQPPRSVCTTQLSLLPHTSKPALNYTGLNMATLSDITVTVGREFDHVRRVRRRRALYLSHAIRNGMNRTKVLVSTPLHPHPNFQRPHTPATAASKCRDEFKTRPLGSFGFEKNQLKQIQQANPARRRKKDSNKQQCPTRPHRISSSTHQLSTPSNALNSSNSARDITSKHRARTSTLCRG